MASRSARTSVQLALRGIGGFAGLIAPTFEQRRQTLARRRVVIDDQHGWAWTSHLESRLRRQSQAKGGAAAIAVTILIDQ